MAAASTSTDLFKSVWIYDFEVTKDDWLMCAKHLDADEWFIAHNDNDKVIEFIRQYRPWLAGFNVKHYDSYILKAVLARFTPDAVKAVNDYIIAEGKEGYTYPLFRDVNTPWVDQIDLMDDCQTGTSLKSFEAHYGMPITESSVAFDIDRAMTEDELGEMIYYCKQDVLATEKLFHLREAYLTNKIAVGGKAGLNARRSAYMTNAKLTAVYLGANRVEHDDEREYVYPANLLREYIPHEVFDFFDRLHDESIPSEELFDSKLDITVGGCPVTMGWGGIHGAIPNYVEESTGTRTIRNKDVASYYPHLMTLDGYCSRNMQSPKVYEETIETRVRAKRDGDKETANALKLVLNTTYGAMLNRYNDLNDPLMARSVCITGQLRLLELSCHLLAECPTLRIVQLNTDGIMVSLDNEDEPTYQAITQEWQDRTGFELEEDFIKKISQKDVNNYVEVAMDGSIKAKGGMLVRGISTAGAFKINNSATIVAKALEAYLAYGTLPEETIGADDTVLDYQFIAKASHKYSHVYHIVDGERVEVQRCNRVYATADERYGTLIKVHAEVGNDNKMAGLPDHCVVDNDNHLSIGDIDKQFYIDLAWSQIIAFLGYDPREKGGMEMNVHEKLLKAQMKFLRNGIDKTGKNMTLKYKFFQLEDIVPIAMPIFEEFGLVPEFSFTNTEAILSLVNVEDPSDRVDFVSPMRELDPVLGQTGREVANVMQRMGMVETYQRRYLLMMCLNIVESDEIDAGTLTPPPVRTAPVIEPVAEQKKSIPLKSTADATVETTSEEGIGEIQLSQLKELATKINKEKKHPDYVKTVIKPLIARTRNFETMTRAEADKYLAEFGEKVNG